MKKIISLFLALLLLIDPVIVRADILAAALQLPAPGSMVNVSPAFSPSLLRGMVIHPDKPLSFDFIVDHGDANLSGDAFSAESQRMVNYFLASLTVPQKDLWVNLSPVEKDRIIPEALIKTELGRDLLAQDYILKQVTSTLIYPEGDLGKSFWKKIYDEAYQKFGVVDVPVDVFNKVWIIPETASVYEKGNAVYIVNAHMKVMLEADYLAQGSTSPVDDLSKKILREVIVPVIEKEVNEGKNFAKLRQIVYAMVLAQWYQDVLKESVLNKAYAGKNKVNGIDLSDSKNKQLIYEQYMAAYRKGVFSYIKEETDRLTNEIVPKKYFSGGFIEEKAKRSPSDLPVSGLKNVSDVKVDVTSRSSAAQKITSSTTSPKVFYNGNPEELASPALKKYLSALQNPGTNRVVSDVSLEAFLDPIKGPAQLALGKGGLGFLTGETWGAYSDLERWNAMGVMPLYSYDKNGNEIDWDTQEGVQPVFVQDHDGRKSTLSYDVEFKGQKERVYVYWVNANGTPVFLIKHKSLFRKLYPGGEEQIKQYGFIGKAYVELMKTLGISPDILRLSEPQLIFVVTAMKNDIERVSKAPSVFVDTKIAMTTHTPERAALPSWDNVGWLKGLVGDDLVRPDIVYADKVNAAGAMAFHSSIINGVSPEHRDITREAVLPTFGEKTTGIQNGSDPRLWRSESLNALIIDNGIANVSGENLYRIGTQQKRRLNGYLQKNGFATFDDIERPLFAAVRRLVEYKSQAILIPMLKWVVGDPDKEFDTPLGRIKGLGANILLGGEALDDVTPEWMKQFKELEQDPDVKGRFVMAERTTGTEFMQLATSGADGWLVMPWMTREASGTSDQRAGLNGHLVIATATGGPIEWIDHGVNGWLVTPFNFEQFKRNTEHAAEFRRIIWAFQNKEVWALTRFYEEGRRQFTKYMKELVDMYREPGKERLYKAMQGSFQAAHRRVSIHRMVQEYGLMFDSVIDGVGVNGFEKRLSVFGEKWESEKLWQSDRNSMQFNLPTSVKPLDLKVSIDGYNTFAVSLSKDSGNSGLTLRTPTGTIAIADAPNVYFVRSNDQFKAVSNPRPSEIAEATLLRIRQVGDKVKVDVISSGSSPVKITEDKAEKLNTEGGIDARNIQVARQGVLTGEVLSDSALEDMLVNAPGLRGVIVSITPVVDLPALLK